MPDERLPAAVHQTCGSRPNDPDIEADPRQGGRVVGATTDTLEAAPVDLDTGAIDPKGRPIAYPDLAAGLLNHLGVDPSGYIANGVPLNAITA